jgi:hypothetical protein
MTLGWHIDRLERRSRGEVLTWWPEALMALLIAGSPLALGLGILVIAVWMW